jgi:hypothetical protein
MAPDSATTRSPSAITGDLRWISCSSTGARLVRASLVERDLVTGPQLVQDRQDALRPRLVQAAEDDHHFDPTGLRQLMAAMSDVTEGRTARAPQVFNDEHRQRLDLDDAVAAFNPLCACPIPNASRLAPQAR